MLLLCSYVFSRLAHIFVSFSHSMNFSVVDFDFCVQSCCTPANVNLVICSCVSTIHLVDYKPASHAHVVFMTSNPPLSHTDPVYDYHTIIPNAQVLASR